MISYLVEISIISDMRERGGRIRLAVGGNFNLRVGLFCLK